MKAKKNLKHDLKRNSLLYFMIGLTAVLCMSYTMIEYKAFEPEFSYEDYLDEPDFIMEELPPVVKPPELPKPKIIAPPIIEIAPNDDDIIETVIDPVEPNQDTPILKVSDINVEEAEEDFTVIIDLIDEAPIFPGCENAIDKKACFQKMMRKHVRKNIMYPELAQELNIQGRVATQFIIGKKGTIEGLKMRGPHKVLEKVAQRIISKLPKMKPGKQNGKEAKVAFSMPITFKMKD